MIRFHRYDVDVSSLATVLLLSATEVFAQDRPVPAAIPAEQFVTLHSLIKPNPQPADYLPPRAARDETAARPDVNLVERYLGLAKK